jgi:hypothetical protein
VIEVGFWYAVLNLQIALRTRISFNKRQFHNFRRPARRRIFRFVKEGPAWRIDKMIRRHFIFGSEQIKKRGPAKPDLAA